jgi:integrase/recombinase XerD
MGHSIKLKLDTERLRKDGTCAIYLQIIIDRKKTRVGVDLCWPPDKFNENYGCKPRLKKDLEVNDYNIIINNARAKANQIFMDYRMKDLPINIQLFEKEYYSKLNKFEFIKYFEVKSKERWGARQTSDLTYKMERMVLEKLKGYKQEIYFREFNGSWAIDFDTHLKKHKLRINSRWGYTK